MHKKILVLPGDGIGPEVTEQALKALEAVGEAFGHSFELEYELIGAKAIDETGEPLSWETIQKAEAADAVLLGAIGDPKYDRDPNCKVRPEQGLLALRKSLRLHTNLRPIQTYSVLESASPLKASRLAGVDMLICRELTGGSYFGKKWCSEDGKRATDECAYSSEEVQRIAHRAFAAARNRRGRLCLVDKANVLETSRLWRREIQQMAKDYPDVQVDYMYVDNAAMQIASHPSQFDVILTENMFGDILSDLASVLTGSLGMLPSASLGEGTALFEPCHGSYPQAAGKNIANPMATILSAAMMLDHFELREEAKIVRRAVQWALDDGHVTADIDRENALTCSSVGDLIAIYIEESGELKLNKGRMEAARNAVI